MKQKRVDTRLDEWTYEQIEKICELTGANRSSVVRTMCLQFLNNKSTKVNDIQELVKNTKNRKEILVRIPEELKKKIDQIAGAKGTTVSKLIRDILYSTIQSIEGDEYYYDNSHKKRASNKKYNTRIIKMISDNYDRIKREIIQNYVYVEDVFQDTVLYLTSDKDAMPVKTKGELISLFKRRYNMLMYKSKQEKKERREMPYADYLQAKETTEE
ncbi:MAG: ribbon-helix-helix domain-containing protein [Bacteroides sp.]|jgi:metal-responsive CopG/Arc/MetJ family transcriptional regulator|nr:ribbon-helix-helix domain-containing protein [Bacteroides sp.]